MEKLLNDILKANKNKMRTFLRSVPNEPSTKPRNLEQRLRMISMEMKIIRESYCPEKFEPIEKGLFVGGKCDDTHI